MDSILDRHKYTTCILWSDLEFLFRIFIKTQLNGPAIDHIGSFNGSDPVRNLNPGWADSNRLSISISFIFSEPSNYRGTFNPLSPL